MRRSYYAKSKFCRIKNQKARLKTSEPVGWKIDKMKKLLLFAYLRFLAIRAASTDAAAATTITSPVAGALTDAPVPVAGLSA